MSLPENRDDLRKRLAAGEYFEFYFFYGHKPPAAGVDASCLSQWFVRVFRIEGVDYPTAEHWMMAEKARLFGDAEMLEQILTADGPKEAKACGRKVRGFSNEVWGEHKYEIVKRGNYEKFTQHEDLKEFLVSTAKVPGDVSSRFKQEGNLIAAEESEPYEVSNDGGLASDSVPASDVPDRVGEKIGIFMLDSDGSSPAKAQSNVILVEAAGRDTIWGIGLGKSNPKSLDPFKWRGLNLLGFALTAVRDQIIDEVES